MSKLSLQASIRGSKASEQILEQQEGEHVEANADAEDEDEADVNEEIELETEVEEEIEDEPYCPPNPNFIYVLNTDGSEMILNFNCRKTIFFEYIKQKIGLERDCDIDFCDVKGNLQHVSNLQTNDYVTDSFKAMDTYIVCRVTRGKHGVIVSKEPVLDDWEEKYPAMTAHRYSSSANSAVNKWRRHK